MRRTFNLSTLGRLVHANSSFLFLSTFIYLRVLLGEIALPSMKTTGNVHPLIEHILFDLAFSSRHDLDASVCHYLSFILLKWELLSRSSIVIKRRIQSFRFPVRILITIVFINFLSLCVKGAVWPFLLGDDSNLFPRRLLIIVYVVVARIHINVADVSASLDSLHGRHFVGIHDIREETSATGL